MGTIWYAQTDSVNIDSENEWNDAADGSGNPLTWPTGLASADILCANGKAGIIINVDIPTCVRLSTVAEGTGSGGGGFTLSLAASARSIAAAILAGGSSCLIVTDSTNRLAVGGNINVSWHGEGPAGPAGKRRDRNRTAST